MSMTVLHIAQPTEGGVAAVVTDLTERQHAHGERVVVACPADGRLAGDASRAGAEVLTWQARRPPGPSLRAEVADVRRVLAQVRPDLVHLHSSKAGLAGRLAIRGRLPTVFQPHAWSFAAVRGPMAVASAQWERYGARWSHQLVCVSETELRDGRAAGVRGAASVVRNGVDLDRYTPDGASARARARQGLDLPAHTPLAVCVGRICRQKGQDVLLAAWPAVSAAVPGATLALVGDGPDEAAARASAPPGVRFAGNVTDPRPWYLAADVVVLPSRWEGMALVPLEAMACGRPVLLTDVPGAAESLPPEQVADCLVPIEDPKALARALTGLLSDRESGEKLGAAARTHMREHHDVSRVADQVFAVYDQAIGACRSRGGGPGR